MTLGLGLLRISVVAGGRRVDLAVPPALPVAELVPEAARALGLPDGTYAGLRLAPLGAGPLADDRGLAAQGVPDAAVLVLTDEAVVAPVVQDDPAETAAAAARELPSRPVPVGALAAGVLAGLGVTALLVPGLQRLPPGVPAVALVLAALAGALLPRVALAPLDALPADPGPVVDRVLRAHRMIVAGTAGLAVAVALCVPAVASAGPAGAVLALAAGVLLLVRSRRHRAAAERLAGVAGGMVVLATLAITLLWAQPDWRLSGGLLLLASAPLALLPPPRSWPLLGVLGDLVEQAAVVALLPLLVLASGLLDRLARVAP